MFKLHIRMLNVVLKPITKRVTIEYIQKDEDLDVSLQNAN